MLHPAAVASNNGPDASVKSQEPVNNQAGL
ncbi:hypothetical protein AGR1A_Cc20715 [Agrobacterium fabacearum CFBP 5771]|nr:hypothetical protein AGR1B_Cc110117 [Agrobacterium fabacearum S56]CUW87632.1 hypothetical protein AGR1C_Cc10943 [Agrobacterium fabacearum TT111]CVI15984.1 hypothetical protein AGR1A_Cc20715 [Agrobacterium fabacearum CFBP 5771]